MRVIGKIENEAVAGFFGDEERDTALKWKGARVAGEKSDVEIGRARWENGDGVDIRAFKKDFGRDEELDRSINPAVQSPV